MSHPEGRSNLAQRFSAGKISNNRKAPERRPAFPGIQRPRLTFGNILLPMSHIGENVVRIEAEALRALADRIAGPMADVVRPSCGTNGRLPRPRSRYRHG